MLDELRSFFTGHHFILLAATALRQPKRILSALNGNAVIIVAIVGAIAPTIAAMAALIVSLRTHDAVVETSEKVDRVQHQTDGIKDALIAASVKVGEATGEKRGKVKGAAEEKAKEVTAKDNQAKGAAAEKAKSWWQK